VYVCAIGEQGKPPAWFQLHRVIQSAGLVCTVLALIIAFAMTSKDGKPHLDNPHAQLGLIVTLLGVVQPLNALIRPKPAPRTLGRKVGPRACHLQTKLWALKKGGGVGLDGGDARAGWQTRVLTPVCTVQ
jgi:hypothetical protein